MTIRQLLPLALTIAVAGCNATSTVTDIKPAPTVRAVSIEQAPTHRRLVFASATRSVERARIGFLSNGYLKQRMVELGDVVEQGQIIAQLDNPTLDPAVVSAENRVIELQERIEQLERDITRYSDLRRTDAIAEDQLEKLRSEKAQTEASLAAANAQLEQAAELQQRSALTAPFAGRVVEVMAEPGDFVSAGQPILQISGFALEIPLQMPSHVTAQLGLGQEIPLIFPFHRELDLNARITKLSPAANYGDLDQVVAAIESDNPILKPGLAVEALVPMTVPPSLTVDIDAVFDPGTGRPRVFRIQGDKVEQIAVKVLGMDGHRVRIDSHRLKESDQLAVGRLGQLRDGAEIVVL